MTETTDAKATDPVAAARDARRHAILEAAIQVFIDRGFAPTKMADVARAARLAKGTVYLYFDSKEALFEAAVRQQIVPVVANIEAVRDAHSGTARALVEAQLRTAYEHIVAPRPREIMRCMIAEGTRFPQLRDYYFENVITRVTAAFGASIELGVSTGEFRDADPKVMARVVMGPAVLAGIWTLLFDDIAPLELDAHIDAHIQLALSGLMKA